MPVVETPESLQARKADLFAAIRQLEQDRDDGIIDEDAYRATRRRYENEAAGILERLDVLSAAQELDFSASGPPAAGSRRLAAVAAGAAVVAAMAIFLVGAVTHRGGNQSATGSVPTPVQQVPSQILAAQHAVLQHPRSVDALLTLGNAYLDAGQPAAADRTYRVAMRLGPNRPEPKTLDALAIGSHGHVAQALALLRQVERQHARYSRAWLLDGLLSSRVPHGQSRSIAAWKRFLAVDPHNTLAPRVKAWIAQEEHSARSK
jgi:cytochrome c-type biogenesis protein CcmH/NrfG